ncbi:nucleotide sugar dehydrogenase [Elongatibacter sediminis]|uniref:Nucleotide sugar dehydrogenase n=1 Tax=Elongatibacter sediminis TaxID=3119006 RepID=A0AAW9RI04_9GAMM
MGGLGRVGLPLGITLAQAGLRVCLLDRDADKAAAVNNLDMPFVEHGAEALMEQTMGSGNLWVSLDVAAVASSRYVVVTIGTSLDQGLKPDAQEFIEAICALIPFLNDEHIIIIRSTIATGVLRRLSEALADGGYDAHIAYCPERIAQGHSIRELRELPQIVAGLSETAISASEELFRQVSPSVIRVSVEEAELAKLFSNAWRYIEFAVSNQFYMMARECGADYDRIRHAMTEGYTRIKRLPSPGFAGGPCLFKDTIYLDALGCDGFPLGRSALAINEGMPGFLIDELRQRHDVGKVIIGILGMAFKADTDDTRHSLSYALLERLQSLGARVLCSDEYVDDEDFVALDELIDRCDIVIVGVPHHAYRGMEVPATVEVIDPWGITAR